MPINPRNPFHRTTSQEVPASGQQDAESAATPRAIQYEYDPSNGNIVLPAGAPFDGEPVLIKIASGWCEAYWIPGSKSETQNGVEYEGFHWACMDDDFQADLDDAKFWTKLPQEKQT